MALELVGPESVQEGDRVSLKTVITSNKVGHDFPTGPLDIIQSWVELIVKDDEGRTLYQSGTVDEKGFINNLRGSAEPRVRYRAAEFEAEKTRAAEDRGRLALLEARYPRVMIMEEMAQSRKAFVLGRGQYDARVSRVLVNDKVLVRCHRVHADGCIRTTN